MADKRFSLASSRAPTGHTVLQYKRPFQALMTTTSPSIPAEASKAGSATG